VTARLDRVDAFWARFLGVPVEALRAPGAVAAPHATLAGWAGVFVFVREQSGVASAPPDRVAALQPAILQQPVSAWLDPRTARALVGADAGDAIGPSYQGWLEPPHFRPVPGDVRPLTDGDAPAFAALRAACLPAEWGHGGLEGCAGDRWGAFHGGDLVAVAGLRERAAGALDPGVIVHPEWRGRGHGLAVASAAVKDAVRRDALVLYQTLAANAPAVTIARRLGFERYAGHVAVRLAAGGAHSPV
jgi:GNAT superfamily N-acetyltransferase